MRFLLAGLLAGLAPACVTGAAFAQGAPDKPDPSHIPFKPPADIIWKCGSNGECEAPLFGDPKKPGIYGLLIKWLPGHYSQPHFHSTDRYAYVVSGTWWVSSSDTFDPAKTYPMPAGSFVENVAGTVHWDGAKDEPAILEMVGMGPMVTTQAAKK
jgi:quercetin dioxygenase-like cupin family protein